jgi:hypothetical protein
MGKRRLKNKNTKNKAGNQSLITVPDDIVGTLLNMVDSIYIILILIVLPLYFQDGFNHIGSDKSYFFRLVSFKIGIIAYILLIVHAAIKLIAAGGDLAVKNVILSGRISVTDIFVFIYGAGVIVSYCCSEYKEAALLGADKWYMGTLPQLAFVSVYFFISRYWKINKYILPPVLAVTFVVFSLGVLNRFGIYPIDMKIVSDAFISTVGNINWYCGYAVTVFFAAVSFLWLNGFKSRWAKILMIFYAAAGFATIVTQGSDSGIFAMAVVLIVMFTLSTEKENMLWFGVIISIMAAVCAAIGFAGRYTALKTEYDAAILSYPAIKLFTDSWLTVAMAVISVLYLLFVRLCIYSKNDRFSDLSGKIARRTAGCFALLATVAVVAFIIVNTAKQGALTTKMGDTAGNLLYFTDSWGSGRGAAFRAAAVSFSQQNFIHKLIGVGPDCMSAYIYGSGNESAQIVLSIVSEAFGTLTLTNAHNELLTILLNQGIIGAIAFIGIVSSAVYRYLKKHKVDVAAAACGMGILAYAVNNIFSFQTSINTPTMFVLLGIGECLIRSENGKRNST